jgi:hypothetical protein
MTPDEVKASYRQNMDEAGETIILRRYTGTGTTRVAADTNVRARVTGYHAEELVGGIQQGDRKIIMLVEDLEDAGFSLPVLATDKVILNGHMQSILSIDDFTRKSHGVLIAYEIQSRG